MTPEPRSRHYTSQRLRLHYSEWGDPAAPVLILQHGGRDHSRSWDDIVQALLPDWRIIAPDLRGHGDSEWSPESHYGMDDYLYDHAMLFEALGISRAAVVGHSLGGNIALRHAAIRPDRVSKLVVIEGLGPSPDDNAKLVAQPITTRFETWIKQRQNALKRQRRPYPSIEAAIERMAVMNPHTAPDLARHLAVHGTELVDGGYLFKTDPAMHVSPPIDVSWDERTGLWGAIACETLLVYGTNSWFTDPITDGRAAYFRNARVEIFEDAGHWLHHDRPSEFIALLRGFL